jgi:hypothetical protein
MLQRYAFDNCSGRFLGLNLRFHADFHQAGDLLLGIKWRLPFVLVLFKTSEPALP